MVRIAMYYLLHYSDNSIIVDYIVRLVLVKRILKCAILFTVRNVLVMFAAFSVLGSIALFVTSIIIINALRKVCKQFL